MATAVYSRRPPVSLLSDPVSGLPRVLQVLDQTSSKDRGAAAGTIVGGVIGLVAGVYVGFQVGGAAATGGTAAAGPLGAAGGIAVGIGAGVAVFAGCTGLGAAIGGAIGTLTGEDGVTPQNPAPSPGATIDVPTTVIVVDPGVIDVPATVIIVDDPNHEDGEGVPAGHGNGEETPSAPEDGSNDSEGSSSTSSGCFIGSTGVLLADGKRQPIETIAIGDHVRARDENTGVLGIARVSRTFRHVVPETLLLKLDGGELIETTAVHRVASETGRFVRASDIERGMKVATFETSSIEVMDVKTIVAEATVYNLSVEPFHTFFVGDAAIWVHNDKDVFV